jgi:hypothetical protein
MPSSQARARTAGEAIGRGPAPLVARRAAVDGGCGAASRVADIGAVAVAAAGAAGDATVDATGEGASAAAAGDAGDEAAPPSCSMRISSAPTASVWPTSPPSAITVPATDDGISTVALSVITSAST